MKDMKYSICNYNWRAALEKLVLLIHLIVVSYAFKEGKIPGLAYGSMCILLLVLYAKIKKEEILEEKLSFFSSRKPDDQNEGGGCLYGSKI